MSENHKDLLLHGAFHTPLHTEDGVVDFALRGCQRIKGKGASGKSIVCGKTVDAKIVSRVMLKSGRETMAISGLCNGCGKEVFGAGVLFTVVPKRSVVR